MRFAPLTRHGLISIAVLSAIATYPALSAAQTLPPTTPPPLPAPEPPPPPKTSPPAPPLIRPYAWIKPTIVFAGSPVESFSQPNASAPTAAGNPVLSAIQEESSLTFQVAQSRLGLWFNEAGDVRGQFEMDFVDFSKSSPTTASVPRLRIAKVEWAFTESLVLIAGQDWDLYAPINPYTLNIVGVAFEAGNTGFMRQQVKLIWHDEHLELGGAIGLAAANNNAKELIPEYSRVPTGAVRAALLLGALGRVGISGIATSWRFAPNQPTERKAFAGAGSLYGDLTPLPRFNVRFEGYLGRNLANLGSLAIGNGNAAEDIDELGGFVSLKYGLAESHALYGLAGAARVLNDGDVVPSYTYGTVAAGTTPARSSASLAGTGPGITSNVTARVGYEFRYNKAIAAMLEGFMFHTKHVLDRTYDANVDGKRTAFGAELGLFFTL